MPSSHHEQLDAFAILDITRVATIPEIKASYGRLASLCLYKEWDEHRLMIISAAYEVLTTSREKLMRRRRFTDPYVLFQTTFGVDPSDNLILRASIKRESPDAQQQLSHESRKRRRMAIC